MDQVHPVSLGSRAWGGGWDQTPWPSPWVPPLPQGSCERGPLLRDAGCQEEADFCQEEAGAALTLVPHSIIYYCAAPPGWPDPWAGAVDAGSPCGKCTTSSSSLIICNERTVGNNY